MSGHTPGPWDLHPERTSGDGRGIIALSHPEQVTIAWTSAVRAGLPEGQRIERAEAEANARLIAAAPELLWAVELLTSTSEPVTRDEWKRIVAAVGQARSK